MTWRGWGTTLLSKVAKKGMYGWNSSAASSKALKSEGGAKLVSAGSHLPLSPPFFGGRGCILRPSPPALRVWVQHGGG